MSESAPVDPLAPRGGICRCCRGEGGGEWLPDVPSNGAGATPCLLVDVGSGEPRWTCCAELQRPPESAQQASSPVAVCSSTGELEQMLQLPGRGTAPSGDPPANRLASQACPSSEGAGQPTLAREGCLMDISGEGLSTNASQ